jgi:amidophosphoribosyltransferase
LAHNGELVNCESLRSAVLGRGVGLSTHSDSELITQSLCVNPPDEEESAPDWEARIRHLMTLTKISYSLVIMMKDKIYGVRDPYGNRPLCKSIYLYEFQFFHDRMLFVKVLDGLSR